MATEHIQIPDPQGAFEYFQNKVKFTTGPVEAHRLLRSSPEVQLLDVRRREDYEKGHIPGALSLPQEEWETTQIVSREKLNLIYCYSQVCHLAARAAVFFAAEGFPVMELEGGFKSWIEHGLEVHEGRDRGYLKAV